MLRGFNPVSAVIAGFVGTIIMSIVMYGLPLIGIPPMDVVAALGSIFPLKISPYILGALVHFGNGVVLALIYAAVFYPWLPGPNWLRGALFSLLPWLFAITLLGPSLQLASRIFGAASSSSAANPCAVVNPCAPKAPVNPCASQKVNPCSPKSPANPCAPAVANPCGAPTNPCAAKPANPCAAKPANPCAPGAAAQGGIPPQILSLVVHLIYGAVVGGLYRPRDKFAYGQPHD